MCIHVGDRFYDPEEDMYVTVLELTSDDTAVLQYDNGWPSSLPRETVVDDFLPLLTTYYSDQPPTLQSACVEGQHSFDEGAVAELLGEDDPDHYPKCNRCSISTEVLKEFLGHSIMPSLETICDVCHTRVNSDDCRVDARNRPVCSDCWEDYHDVWGIPAPVLESDYAFYDPACGWFTTDIPDTKECPRCGESLSLISRSSTTFQTLMEQDG